jgi:hypothetical protein
MTEDDRLRYVINLLLEYSARPPLQCKRCVGVCTFGFFRTSAV